MNELSVGRVAINNMATVKNQTLASVGQVGLEHVVTSASYIPVARTATVSALGSVFVSGIGAVCCAIKISTIVAHTSLVRITAPVRILHLESLNAIVWTASQVLIVI